MSSEKYLMFNLEDDSSKKLGEIISNETARKIMNLVAEKELSASDIAKELGLPLNTVGYNINKLVKSGLVKESRSLWSVKGKKIPVYEVARKHIIISPKKTYASKLSSILPVIIVALIFSIFILNQNVGVVQQNFSKSMDNLVSAPTASSAEEMQVSDSNFQINAVDWFLIIIWVAIVAFVIWSYKKSN